MKCIIDDIDKDLLEAFNWYNHGKEGYLRCNLVDYSREKLPGRRRPRKWHHMSRIILERIIGRTLQKDEFPDHINGIHYDNRRINLRVATLTQNNWNRKIHVLNKTGYRGVTLVKGKFIAAIGHNKKRIYLGAFDTVDQARDAYNQAAINLKGEFSGIHRELPS